MIILKSSDGIEVFLTEAFLDHMNAHPDVTIDHIQSALDKIDIKEIPTSESGIKYVSINIFPYKGRSALVHDPIGLNAPSFFAKRKGRQVPSRVNLKLKGDSTNLLTLIIKSDSNELITAYWSSDINIGPEPISPNIDPNTPEGQIERKKALLMWCKYSLSTQEIELDEEPYISNWPTIIEDYGDFYHFNDIY